MPDIRVLDVFQFKVELVDVYLDDESRSDFHGRVQFYLVSNDRKDMVEFSAGRVFLALYVKR